MKIRNILLLAGLAASLAGCVVNQRPPQPQQPDYGYDDDYYDYRNSPSYGGYHYERVIFIRNVPYYVDDNRYIRPIPPRMHDHFRRYPYHTLRRAPAFSRDPEVRDGYRMARIIYLDGTPYHVENNRIAQPLPARLQQRFRYAPAYQGNAGNRPQSNGQHDNGRSNEAPAYGREQERAPNTRDGGRIGQVPVARDPRNAAEQERDERAPNSRNGIRIGHPVAVDPRDAMEQERDEGGRYSRIGVRTGQPDEHEQRDAAEQERDERAPHSRIGARIGQAPVAREQRDAIEQERVREQVRDERAPHSRIGARIEQVPVAREQRDAMEQERVREQVRDERAPHSRIGERTEQVPVAREQRDAAEQEQERAHGRNHSDNRAQAAIDARQKKAEKHDNGKKTRRGKDDDQQDDERGRGNRRD